MFVAVCILKSSRFHISDKRPILSITWKKIIIDIKCLKKVTNKYIVYWFFSVGLNYQSQQNTTASPAPSTMQQGSPMPSTNITMEEEQYVAFKINNYDILSIICKLSLWFLHVIISVIKKQSWYKHIIVDFYHDVILTSLWHILDKHTWWYILIEMDFSSHLTIHLRCDIALRNPFSQKKSMIVYISIKQ